MQKKKKGISIPMVQWIAWVSITLVMFLLMFHENGKVLSSAAYSISNCLFFAGVVYVNVYVLVPYVLKRWGRWLYILAVVAALLVLTAGMIYTNLWVQTTFAKKDMPAPNVTLRYFMVTLFLQLLVFIFSIPVRFALDYFVVRRQQEELQKRTAEAELNLLKAQVQPHFLFNTLNNIYFVAQRESPATAELLEKLSNIMRYFVDEGPKAMIPISRETDFIHDYIHLEKLRMRHLMQTEVIINGEPAGVDIPPMILIPLVENVFKHGVNKRSEDNLLYLRIDISHNSVAVEVRNRVWEDLEPVSGGGNGLVNLLARLQLLYGNRFALETGKQNGLYIAKLKIPL